MTLRMSGALTPTLIPAGGGDWSTRSAGAFFSTNFATSQEIADAASGASGAPENVSHETTIKRSGVGSCRIDIPAASGADPGAARFALGQTRGNGTTTYYGVSIYTPESFLRYIASYSGQKGPKLFIISKFANSNTNNEVVAQETYRRGFMLGYWQDGVSTAVNMEESRSTPNTGSNYAFTNAVDAGAPASPVNDSEYEQRYGPIYVNPQLVNNGTVASDSDAWSNGFPSRHALMSGVPPFEPNGWLHVKVRVIIGTLGQFDSQIDVWFASRGSGWFHAHSYPNIRLGTENGGHSAIWLTPYDTTRTGSTFGDTFICYDELIASASDIAAPADGFIPPYSLPSAGATVAIGTNHAGNIKPSGITATTDWYYALFAHFGGGCFVREFSEGGAWALCGTGGHAVPPNIGSAIFDFGDATWKRLDPQGGSYRDTDYSVAETTGSPDYEISGSGGVPAPAHTYGALVEIPRAFGGGLRGTVMNVNRSAMCVTSVSSTTIYAVRLTDGRWYKPTNDPAPRISHSSWGVLDEPRKRVWLFNDNQNAYDTVWYLDLTDWTWKETASHGFETGSMAQGACWLHPPSGYIYRQGTSGNLWLFDPDVPEWYNLTVSGSLPSQVMAFAYYPPSGKAYWMPETGGGSLTRLTFPADLKAGTYVVDSVSISPSVPARYEQGGSDSAQHYNSLFYNPAIERLAWVPGGANSVYLINPE